MAGKNTVPYVEIGDETHHIRRFSAYKFFEASELVAQIFELVPQVVGEIGDFVREWQDSQAVRMQRATAELRYDDAKKISEEAWQAADHALELPGDEPTREALLARVFPLVFRQARGPVVDLVALALTSNDELRKADEEMVSRDELYGPSGAVGKVRTKLLHDAYPADHVAVLVAAVEQVVEEGRHVDKDALGKLLTLFGKTDPSGADSTASSDDEQSPSRGSRARSRGGRASRSSTASPTASSSA